MGDDFDIGGHSRRFRVIVILAAMVVLLLAVVAVNALSFSFGFGPEPSIEPDPDDREGNGHDVPEWLEDLDIWPESGPGFPDIPSFPEWSIDWIDWFDWFDFNGEPAFPNESAVPPPPYEISIEPAPTPGSVVTVTVKKDDEPAPGIVVAFNGQPVGTTDRDGTLEATVPYDTELEVTAFPPVNDHTVAGIDTSDFEENEEDEAEEEMGIVDDRDGMFHTSVIGTAGGAQLGSVVTTSLSGTQSDRHEPSTPSSVLHSALSANEPDNTTIRLDVLTDANAEVDGVALPDSTATVNFTVDGNPLPAVGVYLDGELIDQTDREGAAEVPFPDDVDYGSTIQVELERANVSTTTEVEIGELTVNLDTGLLPIPGTRAAVEVLAVDSTDEVGIPGANVTVYQEDSVLLTATSNENGEVPFAIPLTNSIDVEVTVEDRTLTASESGMLYYGGGLLTAIVLAALGIVALIARNPDAVDSLHEQVNNALIVVGGYLQLAGRKLLAMARAVRNAIAGGVGGLVERLRQLSLAGPFVFLYTKLYNAYVWVYTKLVGLIRWLLGRREDESAVAEKDGTETDDETKTNRPPEASETGPEPGSAYARLLRYWRWLVRTVLGRQPKPTTTAVEVERRAVEAGFPRRPVRRLRRSFQDVEYGHVDPEMRLETAESAVDTLQASDTELKHEPEPTADSTATRADSADSTGESEDDGS